MGAWRLAFGPQLAVIALIGAGAAGCSDSSRFDNNPFAAENTGSRSEVTGSIPKSSNSVESKPLPHLASNGGDGYSGGGRGMGSYQPSQPASSDVTGSLPPAVPPPPPSWSWEGGTPITLRAGDTPQTLSRRYGVPVAVIMQSNNISNPALVHAGQHLVIPHLKGPAAALAAAPQPRLAANAPALSGAAPTLPPAAPVPPPRMALAPSSAVHVVAAGETLRSIAHMYGKPVLVLAKANNIAPDSRVKIGERIVVPDAKAAAQPSAALPKRAEAPAAAAPPNLASVADSPHSARVAAPA